MGDPAGVGPEICLRAIQHPLVRSSCQPILLGDRSVITEVARRLDLKVPEFVHEISEWKRLPDYPSPAVLDFDLIELEDFEPGRVNARTGEASFQYFDQAISFALEGRIDGIATAPIHKEALHLAGHHFPGHTEILADRSQTEDFCMMLTSQKITCSFVTTHVGLDQVPGLIQREQVLRTIRLTHDALRRMRGREVRLICCGLNPHAGEGGLFGQREEENEIIPALEQARQEGIDIVGPLPADTAFIPSQREITDGYVCMYHDQGSIPLKALAFDEAVNVTLGLPIVRTSVDHGTACDIAWQGRANSQSLEEAIQLAVKLSRSRLRQ